MIGDPFELGVAQTVSATRLRDAIKLDRKSSKPNTDFGIGLYHEQSEYMSRPKPIYIKFKLPSTTSDN